MTIARDEMFGPVVTVTPFETEDEAVAITNESKFGLVSCVYTRDQERGLRVSRRVDAGMVWINNFFRSLLGTPFGGAKDSGYGREHCIHTLREWSRAKNIRMPSGMGKFPNWRGVHDVFGESGCEVLGEGTTNGST